MGEWGRDGARGDRRVLEGGVHQLDARRPQRDGDRPLLRQHTRPLNQLAAVFVECTPRTAPWGSISTATRSSPGTSIGPIRTLPPFAVARSAAASALSTRT